MPSDRCSTGEETFVLKHLHSNRGRCPGSNASGSVTIETTFAIVSLLFVFGMLVEGLSVVALDGALMSCAREAARVGVLELDAEAARARAIEQGRQCQPLAESSAAMDGDYLQVKISREIRFFGLPRTVRLQGTAVALMEPTW